MRAALFPGTLAVLAGSLSVACTPGRRAASPAGRALRTGVRRQREGEPPVLGLSNPGQAPGLWMGLQRQVALSSSRIELPALC